MTELSGHRRNGADRQGAQRTTEALAPSPYPAGFVEGLLASNHVSEPTRRALQDRLRPGLESHPRFFAEHDLTILRAICARLVPQQDLPRPVDIAGFIDRRLVTGVGDGWRYAGMPPDSDAWLAGLAAVEASSQQEFSRHFTDLEAEHQVEILEAVQSGSVPPRIWGEVDPQLFFKEMLSEVVEVFYAHPLAQQDIGYAGMADEPNWLQVGLDSLSEREPRRTTRVD